MKLNKFDALSTEEQKQVIALCETHTYSEAVEILAQPKPDGLDFKTSPSALCRFYTAHSALTIEAQLAHQLTKTLATYRNSNPGAALLTILAAVENHILVELSSGKSISDLDSLLKHLIRLHRLNLATENLKRKAAQQNRSDFEDFDTAFLQSALESVESDHPSTQPTAPTRGDADFSWLTTPTATPESSEIEPTPTANPEKNHETNSEIFRNDHPKTPVIPQIPLKKFHETEPATADALVYPAPLLSISPAPVPLVPFGIESPLAPSLTHFTKPVILA